MRFDILLRRLHPTLKWVISDGNVNDYDKIQWMDETTPLPTRDEFENEWIKYLNAHDLEFVRSKRNTILEQSDRYAINDYPHANLAKQQEWLDYRQALRDLPSVTEDPANPVWPTAPSA